MLFLLNKQLPNYRYIINSLSFWLCYTYWAWEHQNRDYKFETKDSPQRFNPKYSLCVSHIHTHNANSIRRSVLYDKQFRFIRWQQCCELRQEASATKKTRETMTLLESDALTNWAICVDWLIRENFAFTAHHYLMKTVVFCCFKKSVTTVGNQPVESVSN